MMSVGAFAIREVGLAELEDSATVIRESFKTVADLFNLTRENCPTNAAFLPDGALNEMLNRGLRLFGCFVDGRQVGFVAVEKNEGGVFWIEKLAVIPSCRHQGIGAALVKHAIAYIEYKGGNRVSLGTIDKHTVLKDWYTRLGFRETSTRIFPHLPFTVCFMERELNR